MYTSNMKYKREKLREFIANNKHMNRSPIFVGFCSRTKPILKQNGFLYPILLDSIRAHRDNKEDLKI